MKLKVIASFRDSSGKEIKPGEPVPADLDEENTQRLIKAGCLAEDKGGGKAKSASTGTEGSTGTGAGTEGSTGAGAATEGSTGAGTEGSTGAGAATEGTGSDHPQRGRHGSR
jgi:hypothetical protein